MSRIPLFALLSLALAAAASNATADDESKPWSQIDLGTIKQSDPRQRTLKLMAIDGRWDLTPESMYRVAPGVRRFVMTTTKPGFRDKPTYAEFGLELQPCMNYQMVAIHPLGTHNREWMPTVTIATPIKRCLKKFDIAPSDAAIPTPTP